MIDIVMMSLHRVTTPHLASADFDAATLSAQATRNILNETAAILKFPARSWVNLLLADVSFLKPMNGENLDLQILF